MTDIIINENKIIDTARGLCEMNELERTPDDDTTGKAVSESRNRTYADEVARYEQLVSPQKCTCVHCGQVFTPASPGGSAIKRLQNHLGWCKKRSLLRHLVYKDYIFIIVYNPRKKIYIALNEFVRESETISYPELVVGALRILLKKGDITGYHPIQLNNSPKLLELTNGITPYKRLIAALSESDREKFSSFAQHTYETRFTNQNSPVKKEKAGA